MQGSQDIWIRKLKLYRLKPFSFLSLKPPPRARSTPTTPGAASTTGGGQQALERITTPILPSGGARLQVPKVRGHRVTRQGTPLTGHLPIYLNLNLILAESEHRFATYLSDSESHRGQIRTPIRLPPAGSLLPAPPGPQTQGEEETTHHPPRSTPTPGPVGLLCPQHRARADTRTRRLDPTPSNTFQPASDPLCAPPSGAGGFGRGSGTNPPDSDPHIEA